jgi:hypothetical protein
MARHMNMIVVYQFKRHVYACLAGSHILRRPAVLWFISLDIAMLWARAPCVLILVVTVYNINILIYKVLRV